MLLKERFRLDGRGERRAKLAVDPPLPSPRISLYVHARDDPDSCGCRDEVGGVGEAAHEGPACVAVDLRKALWISLNLG